MKKFLKITGITLLVLILLAFLIPILFKKQITELVKKEINNSLTAKVDFDDVSLSLFRRFPKVSIKIDDLSIVGTGVFEKDTLVSAKSIDVSANLISVIKGDDIKVSGIYLNSPRIKALVNEDGQANWDIVKDSGEVQEDTASEPSAFKMTLKKYKIEDGYLYYRDKVSDMYAEISGLDHEGSGDFTADVFTLSTETNANAVSFSYAAVPYLVNTRTKLDADIRIDNTKQLYTFDTDDIQLNNLKLSADGSFGFVNDSTYSMDMRFKTPSNDFKDILSMIPAVYRSDFDKIKTSGTAALEGWVKGHYSETQMPAYDVKLQVADGMFQYPDLPKPVKNINIDLHASNPDGVFDNTVIDLSKGHLEMDNEPFDFRFLFKNPETIQYIDAALKGRLDLAQVGEFVKLEPGTRLAGLLNADAYAKGNMSALQNQSGPFNAGGFINVNNLLYSSPAFPQPLKNGNADIKIVNTGGVADNTSISVSNGHIEVGNDPIDFSVNINRPMSIMQFAGHAKGKFTLDNVKQFVEFESGTSLSGLLDADLKFAGTMDAIDKGNYDQVQTTGSATLTQVKYQSPEYEGGVSVPVVRANFTPKNVQLTEFNGNYLGSTFTGDGSLDNLIGYAIKDEPLTGTLSLAVDKMDLNKWMGTTETPAEAPTETTGTASDPFVVPGNLNLQLNARAGEVTYDKVQYKNIRGRLQVANQAVALQNLSAEALDGTMLFNGSYSTKVDKKNPAIDLSYDVKDINIQKAFNAFNTVQKLMPIGQFLAGKLNSQLSLNGTLNGDMMPNLSSLTGKGNLLLLEGVLHKFAPLEKLANTLQISELQSLTLKDIKNSFEFKNGQVLVKPFTVKVKDIEMEIGGMHGIDQSIDYVIAMKVPRKYLGNQGNALLNNLATEASKKGINVDLGEVVNLNVKMGGSMTNPSIKTDLKEVVGDAAADLKQQAEEFAKEKIDSVKTAIRDTVNAVKNKVIEDVKEKAKDELQERLFGKTDSTKAKDSAQKKPQEQIKGAIKDILNKPKKSGSGN